MKKNQSIRNTAVLSDNWKFQIDMCDIGEKEQWFSDDFDCNDWASVTVPQSWDFYETALKGHEGIGWYVTTINPDDFVVDRRTEIIFGRVMYHSKVWLNGKYIGENIDGYLPFDFNISDHLKPDCENKLVLKVDNRPRVEWLPAAKQIEWILHGGILESVKLVGTSKKYIEDLTVRTILKNGSAHIEFIVNVANETASATELEMNVRIIRNSEIIGDNVKICCKPNKCISKNIDFVMENAELWSPDKPALYTAEVSLNENGVIIDNLTERFGIREVNTSGTSILLNGEPFTIKGVNRYEFSGEFSPTVSEDILRDELSLMKKVGINTIRVHYPQSPRMLSLYDEYGFVMFEEIPINWWGNYETPQSLDILDQAKSILTKMIMRDKNHPCVIVWSMANESKTNSKIGITVMRKLMRLAKSLDPTRLVTFVVNKNPNGHLAFDEADIVCINKYNGSMEGDICCHISDIDSFAYKPFVSELTLHCDFFKNKPIVIAEFGTACIKGICGDVNHSEKFQAAYIERIWEGIKCVPGVSGGILWSWADYYHGHHFVNHVPFGPYGVVTIDRKPKKSLDALARMYK